MENFLAHVSGPWPTHISNRFPNQNRDSLDYRDVIGNIFPQNGYQPSGNIILKKILCTHKFISFFIDRFFRTIIELHIEDFAGNLTPQNIIDLKNEADFYSIKLYFHTT